jgi:hypothetical protein
MCCRRLAPMRLDPLLVFLNLLVCQPEGVRDIGLAHIEHEPAHAHTAAAMLVGGIDSAPWWLGL